MHELPLKGLGWDTIESSLQAFRSNDFHWRDGRVPYFVWCADDAILEVQMNAYRLYHVENTLGSKRAFPSLDRMERDVVEMSLRLLGGGIGSGGTITAGGTESNFLAMKAAREYARATQKGLSRPNIVVPESAHPSLVKGADYLDLQVRRVPYSADFRSDVCAMAQAIDDQTVMLLGSAPQFATGVFDNIADLATLALERNLWLHVDACVGGFLAPFARKLGHPLQAFDLSVRGVTTLSADLHKYGYAAKGASLLLYSNAELLEYQRFSCEWANGVYTTDTFLGTRSGGAIAAAWAVMHFLGETGYIERARTILTTVSRLAAGIDTIAGLETIRPYDLCILLYRSVEHALDINAVAEGLTARGWYVGRARKPHECIHMAVNPVHAKWVDQYLADLRSATEEARTNRPVVGFDKHSY